MEIEVINDSGVVVDESAILAQAEFCMRRLGLAEETELAIRLVDVEEMTRLHVEWMDLPGPTDVLSFPMDELRIPGPGESPEPGMLGDIAICPDAADQPLGLLLTHGILHLLGFDHADEDEYAEMFARQSELIAAFEERT